MSLPWSAMVCTMVRRMLLAWKKAQRLEASTFLLIDSVWAPLPSVSEIARKSARTAIRSAIFLFEPDACSACSACSMLSCALINPSWLGSATIDRTAGAAQEASAPRGLQEACYDSFMSASPPRMRAGIDFQQPLGIDAGIDLRGRERGVAEQFLDRAQVAAARQQMRGEGMPQRVRGRALGQAERAAQSRHGELHDTWRQRAAFGADKERAVGRQIVRTERHVLGNQALHLRQHRHHALLAAFTRHRDGVA